MADNNISEPLTDEDALVASTVLPEDFSPSEATEVVVLPTSNQEELQKRFEEEERVYHEPLSFKEEGHSRTQILYDLIRQLRNGGDLYRISVPSSLLAPLSMLEYISNVATPHDFLLKLSKHMDPEQRFLTLLKWLLSNLAHTPKKGIYHSKPYNAVLGEIFRCKFYHEDSVTYFLGEQVSHHPPVTAITMLNREKNISISGTVKPKSKFHGNSASTLLEGEIVCVVNNLKERYTVQFPWVLARGLILGNQCIELYEKMKIKCEQTGLCAVVDFNSGNKLVGEVKKEGNLLYKLSGVITDKVIITNTSNKRSMTFIDGNQQFNVFKYVKPVAKQVDCESRRVWHKVTVAVKKSDFATANAEKHVTEQAQRELRKKMEENHEQHVCKYFNLVSENLWKCVFYNEEVFDVNEKGMNELEVFKLDEDEIDFVRKIFPKHKVLDG